MARSAAQATANEHWASRHIGLSGRAIRLLREAWLLLQVPYGIIGVTLLTAIMPRLSHNAADGETTDRKSVV